MSVVVADTSPLNYLIQCEAIDVLPRLYQQVVIPQAVFDELTDPGAHGGQRATGEHSSPMKSAARRSAGENVTIAPTAEYLCRHGKIRVDAHGRALRAR